MNWKLEEFLTIDDHVFEFVGNEDRLSRSPKAVSIDSRSIQRDEIYFALKGENHDGHDFLQDVFTRKAIAAVVSRSWWETNKSTSDGWTLFVVEDPLLALQESAGIYRKKFTLPVLAVTGSNGKTTTKEMIAAVLSQKETVCKTAGNLNNHIGLPLSLFSLTDEHTVAVVEMGMNHFGEIARLCEIAAPTHGLITNIGRGHTEFLRDLDGVATAKTELFQYLQEDGTGFLNIDDPMLVKHAPKMSRQVTYGFTEQAQVTAKRLGVNENAQPRMEFMGQQIELNVLGHHNLNNALAAAAVGIEFGVDAGLIASALQNVKLPGKRMEVLRRGEILILNDSYNANPDSTFAALSTMKSIPTTGKKIFVFGDMLELGEGEVLEHEKIGLLLGEMEVDLFLGYGPLSAATAAGAQKAQKSVEAKHFKNKQDLISVLKEQVRPNDIILVKGSRGMKMEEIIENL